MVTARHPIGPNDTVSVKGRYFVYDKDGSRFLLQGIAFPTTARSDDPYDEAGHNAVIDQLAELTDINTVRVYRMNCTEGDYFSGFLRHAAKKGIYVMLPLTSPAGDGSLDRLKPAPKCYPRHLYTYGTACLDQYLQHPNVIAGVIGNEVMNSVDTWLAAPCVKAYARDLKQYMQLTSYRPLPLLYAAQHDSITAEILADQAMKMTVDYLSCDDDDDNGSNHFGGSIDAFGINVESWCSSLQTFQFNEDGTESSYHALWQALHNVSIPLIFSEMGCSKPLFNHDNGLPPQGVRDWAQVPVVLNSMADTFSGFCAYAYYGNPVFGMMEPHRAWDGHTVLQPSDDFDNFRKQLHAVHQNASWELPTLPASDDRRPSCQAALEQLQHACIDCNFNLFPMQRMPLYYKRNPRLGSALVLAQSHSAAMALVIVAALLLAAVHMWRMERRQGFQRISEVEVE